MCVIFLHKYSSNVRGFSCTRRGRVDPVFYLAAWRVWLATKMKAAKVAYRQAKRELEKVKNGNKNVEKIQAAKEKLMSLKAKYKAFKQNGTKRKRGNGKAKVCAFEAVAEFSCFKSEWNFEALSEIQASSWPVIMEGKDAICVAKTGSGKTLAFLLPVIFRISKDINFSLSLKETPALPSPLSLVHAPTRELAIQINKEADRFGKKLGVR